MKPISLRSHNCRSIPVLGRLFIPLILLLFPGLAGAGKLYTSYIYNNTNSVSRDLPIYSFLGYGKLPADKSGISPDTRYLFVILNGQQSPCAPTCVGEKADNIFGKNLTGAHRVKTSGKAFWDGSYEIFTREDTDNDSLAAYLHETYGTGALVLDVLSTKYLFAKPAEKNKKVLDYVADLVSSSAAGIEKASGTKPKVFIVGFSRGAVLTYQLIQKLKGSLDIALAVSLDPVINPALENGLITRTALYSPSKKEWHWAAMRAGTAAKRFYDFFHVLRDPKVSFPYYVAFQRYAMRSPDNFEKPVGSAVEGARSFCDDFSGKSCSPPAGKGQTEVHRQYNGAITVHSPEVVDTYAQDIIELVEKHFPVSTGVALSLPEQVPTADLLADGRVRITSPGGNVSYVARPQIERLYYEQKPYYVADRIDLGVRTNYRDLQTSYAVAKLPAHRPEWSGFTDSGEIGYTFTSPGVYLFQAKVKNRWGSVSEVSTKIFHIGYRPPRFTRIAQVPEGSIWSGEKISFEWRTDEPSQVFYALVSTADYAAGEVTWKRSGIRNSFTETADETGEYVFLLKAVNTVHHTSSGVEARRFSVTDYVADDEVYAGVYHMNGTIDYALGTVAAEPSTGSANAYLFNSDNYSLDWAVAKDMKVPFVISKTWPLTSRNLAALRPGDLLLEGRSEAERLDRARSFRKLVVLASTGTSAGALLSVKDVLIDEGTHALKYGDGHDNEFSHFRVIKETVDLGRVARLYDYCTWDWPVPKATKLALYSGGELNYANTVRGGEKLTMKWRNSVPMCYSSTRVVRKGGQQDSPWSDWRHSATEETLAAPELPGSYFYQVRQKSELDYVSPEISFVEFRVKK